MPTFIKNYLAPISTVVLNGILSYFINQLPSIRQDSGNASTGLPDASIFAFTAICVAILCILTFVAQSQQNSVAGNTNLQSQGLQSNWIGGFVLFLLGIVLYGLLQINIIPKQSSVQFSYISLILCGFGAVVPSFLLMQEKWQNILLLLSAGIGLFLSFHYFSVNNLNALFISFSFTAISLILLAAKTFLVKVIRDVALFWQDLQNQQATEISQLIITKLEDLVSPFKRNYYKALKYKYRDDETQGLYSEKILEFKQVFVELKIAAKSVSNVRQDIIPSNVDTLVPNMTIWDCLAAKNEEKNSIYKKLVILGRPGSGKTTLLRHLTLVYATKEQRKFNPETPILIPVLFYLREIRDIIISQSPSLKILITQQIEKLKINDKYLSPPSHWVNNKLERNKFIIMLDGLDEVADKSQRQQVRTWVDSQMQNYPDTVFLLTSRPNGYKELESQTSVDVLEVQPFNKQQFTDFLKLWYLQTEFKNRGQNDEGVKQVAEVQAHNLINQIVNNPSLIAMAVNPLLLKMIATVHSRGNMLPAKRVELYKEICQILLEKRQRAKNMPDILDVSQKQSILQELAFKLMQEGKREFELPEADNWISQQLITLPKLNNTEEFIKHIRDDCALLVEKEIGIYEFAHLSFQEYLAAIQIKELNQEQILINNINNTWWAETIRLYAAQVKDASNLVRAVVNMPSSSINAFLVVADYEDEGWRINPQVKQLLFNKLDAGLESNNPEIFKLAVEVKLAKRLNHFRQVNEDLEIDDNYITSAEYELFEREIGRQLSQHRQNRNFTRGTAKNIIDGIEIEHANSFCHWLSSRDKISPLSDKVTWYRLLTPKEQEKYNTPEDKKTAIRLLRQKLPSKYNPLVKSLMQGDAVKSHDETWEVMLKVAGGENQHNFTIEDIENFPCEDLRIIDTLWASAEVSDSWKEDFSRRAEAAGRRLNLWRGQGQGQVMLALSRRIESCGT
ncbi:hypothetical protein CAL7716_059220 [Calothrix sp. PCC 7716]|nr:hypothetical protein CAL7716_059220 [Calothrix sp. PCC 7716]